MKKVSKAILIALGVVVLAAAIGVLCVNLYIQSADTQARIQDAFGRILRTPVKISSLSYMPWTGLKLAGITSTDTNSPDIQPLQISRIKARIQLMKLLHRKVVIKELTIDGAKVSWDQSDTGVWQLPTKHAPPPPPIIEPAPGAPAPEQPAPSEPAPSAPPAPAEETEASPMPPPVVMLNHFRLRDAAFDFFDNDHRHVVSVKGINVDSRYPSAEAVNGLASMSLVNLQNVFYIRDWQAAFTYTPKLLTLFNASCTIASGTATGGLHVKIAEPNSPFDVDVNFQGIDVEHLIAEAGISRFQASGTLAGTLHLQGDMRTTETAAGKGRLEIANLHVKEWELFRTLGVALHNKQLQEIDFSEAYANYHIGDGKVFLDELTLKSPVLTLNSQGMTEISNGLLALKSRLTIGADIARSIPDFLMDGFEKDAATGARYIDFNVYGTVDSPKTDLLKIIGKGLGYKSLEKGAGNILKNLLGGKRNPPQAAPPQIPSTTQPSPAAQQPPAGISPAPAGSPAMP